MPFLIFIATILYVLFVLGCAFNRFAFTVNGYDVVDSPFLRALIALVAWPVIGLALWLIGLIGRFMLLPITG